MREAHFIGELIVILCKHLSNMISRGNGMKFFFLFLEVSNQLASSGFCDNLKTRGPSHTIVYPYFSMVNKKITFFVIISIKVNDEKL